MDNRFLRVVICQIIAGSFLSLRMITTQSNSLQIY